MNLSQFFISRPVFAGVLSALILIAGLISIPNLPISEYPEVVPPTVVVRATYPGANPKVIADTVAGPLEQAITGVEDMLYQFSQATSDGVMTLTVTFKLGTDVDKAQVLVQNRVAQATPKLPQDVQRLGITTAKASPDETSDGALTDMCSVGTRLLWRRAALARASAFFPASGGTLKLSSMRRAMRNAESASRFFPRTAIFWHIW